MSILYELARYCDRKAASDSAAVPPAGFEKKRIAFEVVVKPDGSFGALASLLEGEGKKKIGKERIVPMGQKRASGIAPNLLWDTAEYVFGFDGKGGKQERVNAQHQAFKQRQFRELDTIDDDEIRAFLKFIAQEDILGEVQQDPTWSELQATPGALVSFRIQGRATPLSEHPKVIEILGQKPGISDEVPCLITGKPGTVARLHASFQGVTGAQTSGASLVSFNCKAFNSYGKNQGDNAPVSEETVFKYSTALKTLLARDSEQKLQLGGNTFVFWASEENPLEWSLPLLFASHKQDDPDRNTRAIREVFKQAESGRFVTDGDRTRFHVLGLTPNAARIAVSLWETWTVAEMAKHIRQHFIDLEIDGRERDKPLPLFLLLVRTAAQGDGENINPRLPAQVMRSILNGTPYPRLFFQSLVMRYQVEKNVDPVRAAAIKACLNRFVRTDPLTTEKELTVSLDEECENIGYRLGRLFAVLEKIQGEALGADLNATIRDRYFASASCSPAGVFPILIRLSNHHLSKIGSERRGRVVNLERLLASILEGISTAFPGHLNLEEQGRFAIGYFHQKSDLYKKKEKTNERESDDVARSESV